MRLLKKEIDAQFGANPLDNADYGKIINQKHFDRLTGLIQPERVAHGGVADAASIRITPTILDGVTWSDPVMQEEIFGPILPILTYQELDKTLADIETRPHPLALYCFTEQESVKQQVLQRCHFGGGCFNDTLIHLATAEMPFGGIGESGMGQYHGQAGFDEFTHMCSIVDRATWFEMSTRYQPYTKKKFRIIKRAMR